MRLIPISKASSLLLARLTMLTMSRKGHLILCSWIGSPLWKKLMFPEWETEILASTLKSSIFSTRDNICLSKIC